MFSFSTKKAGVASGPAGESFWKYLEKEEKTRYTIDSAKTE